MNPVPIASCDVCLGSALVAHRAAAATGRPLVTCTHCGFVTTAERAAQNPSSRPRDARADAQRVALVMRSVAEGRVLEIGCSEGRFLDALDPARYVAVGLEVPGEAADRAASLLRARGERGAVIAGGLTPPATMEPESFDLVVMFEALDRAPSPRALLMETARVLRNGGQVLIETPSNSSLTAMLMGARWGPLNDPLTAHIFHPPSLERLVATCGLMPTSVRTGLPLGWPRPGSILCTARKTSETLRVPDLQRLAVGSGDTAPAGAR